MPFGFCRSAEPHAARYLGRHGRRSEVPEYLRHLRTFRRQQSRLRPVFEFVAVSSDRRSSAPKGAAAPRRRVLWFRRRAGRPCSRNVNAETFMRFSRRVWVSNIGLLAGRLASADWYSTDRMSAVSFNGRNDVVSPARAFAISDRASRCRCDLGSAI